MLHVTHHDGHGTQRKKSMRAGIVDAEICGIALAMPRVTKQRSAGASEPNDSAHQGEWECHTGLQPARAAMRMAHYAAISPAVHIEVAHTQARDHYRTLQASCHRAMSEDDYDYTKSKNTLSPGGTRPC